MNEREVFITARQLASDEERRAYLDNACGGDAPLRARLDELIEADEQAGSFLCGGPAAYLPPLTERPITESPGSVIGPYTLLEQIGEGGFGVVFMAQQTVPLHRKVAIKVIKPGMDTRQVIARFEAERQALALMDHPNIARVLDAGTTASGRPYFVMQLVRGVPITQYCDDHQLAPRGRLDLFIHVCHAVQHAHQKGIIHRDIKPNNVLVTQHDDKPFVKVIDFGVAKATASHLSDDTLFTGFAQMIGTPLYMSPEQAAMNGVDVDTRSDIYSLGVLLYELLTGTTPFDGRRLQRAAFDEIRRIIREEEPEKPSARLCSLGDTLPSTSAVRTMEPRKLSQLLRGDLDWIVMKALEKDRTRRYETATGLATDILNYLADEPVSACPPSRRYRFRKLARRNLGAFVGATASVAVVLLMLATLAISNAMIREEQKRTADEKEHAEQARRLAENRADEVRAGLERLKIANSLLDRGKMHAAVQRWDDANTAFTEAVELHPEHGAVWYARGDMFAHLGLWDLASADFAREFEPTTPDSSYRWYRHALLRLHLGDEQGYRDICRGMQQRFQGTSNRQIVAEMVRTRVLVPDDETDTQHLVGLARSAADTAPGLWYELYVLGIAHYRAGQYEEARQQLQASLGGQPDWPVRAISNPVLAMACYRLGRRDEAREALDAGAQAIDQWTNDLCHSRAGPLPPSVSHQGATGVWPVAWWDWLECRHYFREASLLIDGVAPTDDPRLYVLRCRAFAALRWNSRAEAEYAKALRLAPEDRQVRLEAHRTRGYCRIDEGQWRAAAAEFSAACELAPDDTYLWRFRAVADMASGDMDAYRQTCGEMLDRFEGTSDPLAACNLLLACVLRDAAVPDMSRLLPVADVAVQHWHFGTWVRGGALYRAGRDTEAIECFERESDLVHLGALEWCFLAMAHHRLGRSDEARRCLGEASRWIEEANRNTDDDLAQTRPHWSAWWEQVAYPLLLREAEVLLNAGAPNRLEGAGRALRDTVIDPA